jgi:ribosome-interacting GTPase 1
LKSIHDIPVDIRRAISSIEVFEEKEGGIKIGETKKIKLWSKDSNIETLMKHLGLLKENINIKHSGNISTDPMAGLSAAERLVVLKKALKKQ